MALPMPLANRRGGNLFETILSALVVLVAIGFFAFFMKQVGTGHLGSYMLRVSLADAAGLSVGSEVRLAGAKIGSVTGLTLEQPSYRAIVEVRIRDDLFLPQDSAANVSSSALGDVYLSLNPGRAPRSLSPGGLLGAPIRPTGTSGHPS